ncbi:unnamed protein product [Linum tenue]|uniref:NPH3 domain-containing protein n=1 Tax=Linum tenue TaxID=586396 RepID=A0AAV0J814_9ROSI|nr:unnamed protein product [Linum tenue]
MLPNATPRKGRCQPAMSSSSSSSTHHLLSDLAIHVNSQETFFLNEKIVCAYLGRLRKIIKQEKRRTQIKISWVEIDDFPCGPSGFELVAGFCYNGGRVSLSASNVSLLHCSAVFLGMTDKVRPGNLLSQTEDFLEGMLDWPLPDVVSCLKTCDSFFPYADSLGLLQKLVSGLLVKIAGGRCNSADHSSASSSSSSPFDDQESPSKLRFSFSSSKPGGRVEWWFDDLVSLSPLAIEMLVKTLGSYGSENNSLTLTRFLLYYLNKHKNWVRHKSKLSSRVYSGLADTAIHGVILGGRVAFSYRGLLWVFRVLCGFGPTKACEEELERMIGESLDEARLDDLLVCGNGGGGGSAYDVDLVIRLVRIFVNSMNQNQSQKMRRVVRVIDEYLREISPDHNLKMPKFVEVAESLPKSARDSFDGVYRAIDIYLESHPTLSFKERSRLCRCLNFDKLSMETCKEIAKNPKFPPTVAVQALMSKTSMLPTPLMPPSPAQGDHHHHHRRPKMHDKLVEISSKSASLSESPRMAKVKEKKKNVGLPDLHVRLDKYTCSPARGTQAKRQVVVPVSEDKGEKMEMNIVRMQKRVVELERACTEMKNQMSRTTTEHHNDSGPPYDGDAGGGLKLMAVLPSSCGESLGRICF